MAAAKKAKEEPAKKPGTALVNIREELKKAAADDIRKRIGKPSGDMIRVTQDKYFVLPNGVKDNKPMRLVILDFVSINQFFDRPFKKGEESPPACFAIGTEAEGLIPSANSPKKEAEGCDICPNNAFGSKGAGKACSNGRLLAVVEDSDNPEAPIRLLKVSATAIKGFDAYVKTIQTQFDTTVVGVTTEVYFDPNQTYGSLRFGSPEPNANLEVHYNRLAAARERLLTEPDVSQYEPLTPTKKKR